MADALETALTQVLRGDDSGALETLLRHWRTTRTSSVASLIDLLDARKPGALSRQLAAVVTPRVVSSQGNLAALKALDDPRVSRFALDALADPPFCAVSGEPFLLALAAEIERLDDARLVDELPKIRDVLRARLTRKPMFERVVRRLDAIAAGFETPRPIAPTEAKLFSALKPAEDAESLLARVYAHPNDETARRVYADFLLDHGEPRGELIALQMARAPGAEPSDRESELLKKHGKEWLGALSVVLRWGKSYSGTRFERGFVSVADFIDNAEKKTALIATDPGWSTVEVLEGSWPNALLAKAPLRSLKHLDRTLDGEVWAALSSRKDPLNIQSAQLGEPNVDLAAIRRVLPKLDTLTAWRQTVSSEDVAAFAALDVRKVLVQSWYRGAAELPAAKREFAQLLERLEGLKVRVSEVAVSGPFAAGKPAEPVVFVRDASGALRRA